MTALSAARLRTTRPDTTLNLPVKALAQIYQGGMVAKLAGVAIAARAAATRVEMNTLRIVGVADVDVLGGAVDGDKVIDVAKGVFRFANSADGDLIAKADIGSYCFATDDQTVAKTVGGGARALAGRIIDVDSVGVWVEIGEAKGPRRLTIPFAINQTDTLAPTNAELVSPVVGAITMMDTIVQISPTTGGDVTALVGVTAVDGLACTVADAAAKGSVVTDAPTMGHASTVVAEGSRIQVAPAAAFATAGAVSGFVEITY